MRPIRVGRVTTNLFPLLGVTPALGRGLPDGDALEADEASPQPLLISDGLWRQAFGGAPDVVGQRPILDGRAAEVAGVLPADFGLRLPSHVWYGSSVDAWMFLPAALHADVTADVRPVLGALLAGVLCVLLIGCANVANLQLMRATRERRQLVLRSALGASRGRILAQVLTESAALAALGGIAGLAGSLAYAVSLRRRENGVRLAVGASPASVARMIVGWGGLRAGLGALLGLGGGVLLAGLRAGGARFRCPGGVLRASAPCRSVVGAASGVRGAG